MHEYFVLFKNMEEYCTITATHRQMDADYMYFYQGERLVARFCHATIFSCSIDSIDQIR